MNKQQLAAKIWESANKMRSKIEANEYKDYILGFMFYKFLSDKELKFLRKEGFSEEDIHGLTEDKAEEMEYIQKGIGYFITYENLFSTWIDKGNKFDVADVRNALKAFTRRINPTHKKVFDRIFNTLETGLSKLGDSSGTQTKAISGLLYLIKDIPTDGRQGYDVLGFIYEYLLSMFAANAGKKAGEFYTPHEVSLLMSEIVAAHLKNRESVKIYDPTSGSGSLLINIGRSVAKYMSDKNRIRYYAQELKENTYNLTRMNLVMRDIMVDNIITRNGDTLEDDWPYFDDNDPSTYAPLYVDAVVSNPPYSQNWDPANKDTDPRYKGYGLAPKSKADYAFLLHDLYHLVPNGIMTIVLPHGVLFRGGTEGVIRKNLIERNNIDAIIGMPANIFFGTSISTIIMVLRQKRPNTDVLIIDASKGFIKEGKNNKLQAAHIQKIVNTFVARADIEGYSRKVSREKIQTNEYNLNISRYIDSTEPAETWDIYATMFGGIPLSEAALLRPYWDAFPGLKDVLFQQDGTPYAALGVSDIRQAIMDYPAVQAFSRSYEQRLAELPSFLYRELIDNMLQTDMGKEEAVLGRDVFQRLENIPLVDRYDAYQKLDDAWQGIAVDLEIVQTEGFAATKQVDPNMVIKKKNGKEEEVQEGWRGHVLPFDLVQREYFGTELKSIADKESRLADITAEYGEIIESLLEEEKDGSLLNDANDAFVTAELNNELKGIYADVENEEIRALYGYLQLLDTKVDKASLTNYQAAHSEVGWANMETKKDGTYGKKKVTDYLKQLQKYFVFDEESFEGKIVKVGQLIVEESELKSQVKLQKEELHERTKSKIEGLSDDEVRKLLKEKWIDPLIAELMRLPQDVLDGLVAKVQKLADKYAVTYADVAKDIRATEKDLSAMLDDLTGNEFDQKGLSEFQKLLKGE